MALLLDLVCTGTSSSAFIRPSAPRFAPFPVLLLFPSIPRRLSSLGGGAVPPCLFDTSTSLAPAPFLGNCEYRPIFPSGGSCYILSPFAAASLPLSSPLVHVLITRGGDLSRVVFTQSTVGPGVFFDRCTHFYVPSASNRLLRVFPSSDGFALV